MALTLTSYADLLDERGEPRPEGPIPKAFGNAKPAIRRLPKLRCVIWGGYGTLLLIQGGTCHEINPDPIMKNISFKRTLDEFKMWGSMSRKPGDPGDQLAALYDDVKQRLLAQVGLTGKIITMENVWEGILQRLQQKNYSYDASQYGSLSEYAAKIAFFYLRASQGVSCFPNAYKTLKAVHKAGIEQGIHANGLSVTPVQLYRELACQGKLSGLGDLFQPKLCFWSFAMGVEKQTEKGMQTLRVALKEQGVSPAETLYIGCDVENDIAPAKRHGFLTALLLADQDSAKVMPAQLKDEKTKPHLLLTAFEQVLQVLPAKTAT